MRLAVGAVNMNSRSRASLIVAVPAMAGLHLVRSKRMNVRRILTDAELASISVELPLLVVGLSSWT